MRVNQIQDHLIHLVKKRKELGRIKYLQSKAEIN